jgi:hypothetical protein
MVRARLMALVNSRWCFAQLPDTRLGMILPRSVVHPYNRSQSSYLRRTGKPFSCGTIAVFACVVLVVLVVPSYRSS